MNFEKLLSKIPEHWRLHSLGQTEAGGWICELVKGNYKPTNTIVCGRSDPITALKGAIAIAQRNNENGA